MHGYQAVEVTVPLGIRVQLINESKLAIPPGSGLWKDAFDKGPRTLKFLVRELLRRRPTPARSRVRRKFLSVHVVTAGQLCLASPTSPPAFQQSWQIQGKWDSSQWRLYRCETSRASMASVDLAPQ